MADKNSRHPGTPSDGIKDEAADRKVSNAVAKGHVSKRIERDGALREGKALIEEKGFGKATEQIAKNTDRRTFLKTMGVLAAGVGLGAVAGPEAFAQAPEKKYKVAYSLLSPSVAWVKNGMDTLTNLGAVLGFEVSMFDSNLSAGTQRSQLEDIATNPKQWTAVFIQPNSIGTLADPVTSLVKEGVIVADVDTRLVPDPSSLGVITFTEVDNVLMAEQVTEALCAAINYEGGIVETQGNVTGTQTQGRHQGFTNVVQKYPKIKVLSNQPANWDLNQVAQVWNDLLTRYSDQIKAAFFHNDDMALAAQRTITSRGLKAGAEGILLGGIDAQAPNLRQMAFQGREFATHFNSAAREHGYAMWTVYYALVKGEKTSTIPKFLRVDGPVITRQGWGEAPGKVGNLTRYSTQAIIESYIWENEHFLI